MLHRYQKVRVDSYLDGVGVCFVSLIVSVSDLTGKCDYILTAKLYVFLQDKTFVCVFLLLKNINSINLNKLPICE